MSPDVNAPGYRSVDWDTLFENYYESARGLVEGGVDAILVETVFDTLNCKAALAAVMALFEDLGQEIPVMVSGTITDAAGRLLSGQTPEAFWLSISHAPLLSVGFSVRSVPATSTAHSSPIAMRSPLFPYFKCGLPNAFGGYDETPEQMAEELRLVRHGEYHRRMLRNHS